MGGQFWDLAHAFSLAHYVCSAVLRSYLILQPRQAAKSATLSTQ